ncbi:uncharacterized protein BO66DRAFT_393841 [Aspergillus aculeatinus CBS 121060]|uniref:Uncharacterized protein n=1 Tax=Aspergillus aculeatinus CBS 121060 TaxID=1448322 RepID=A0ACD1H1H8_9EURO|nr:hypothetical protein BO66DRAFT_393841 [Aspergillus aculeatinus CBS 121060]RAH67399.1 hypothetical protein BO66DRAFT_393841 [Aspergillus aculeatinus CBS 121060]
MAGVWFDGCFGMVYAGLASLRLGEEMSLMYSAMLYCTYSRGAIDLSYSFALVLTLCLSL